MQMESANKWGAGDESTIISSQMCADGLAAERSKLQTSEYTKSIETFSDQVVQSQRDRSAKLEATRRCVDVHPEEQSRVDVHSATQEQS